MRDARKKEAQELKVDGPKLATRPCFYRHAECSFIRCHDFWMIHYHGQTAYLKCTRGLQCLAILLRNPDKEIHVSELLATIPEAPATRLSANASGILRGDGNDTTVARLNVGTPIWDAQTKADCKRRLSELRQEMEDARGFNDMNRATKAHSEMDAITQHLASAVGLGGKDRRASSAAERARSAATKRIKEAIHRIADVIPDLGHHLAARIKTGYFCSYNPHPDRPVAWKF